MSGKLFAWLATDSGKTFSFGLSSLAITGGVLAQWLPNTILLKKYQELVQLYQHALPVPVPPEVLQRAKMVEKDMKLEIENDNLRYFTVYGFDMFHAGSLTYRFGAIVGIPISFSYKQLEDIDKKNIMVGNKPVPWLSPVGQSLASSLLLSDSAKKFAIAREIDLASSHRVSIQSTINAGIITSYYLMTSNANKKLKLFQKPLKLRMVFYGLAGAFFGILWIFLRDVTNVYLEEKADKNTMDLGEEYIRGAVEYYTKILQRNVALRSLLGDEGAKLYTAFGNDHAVFRTKHLPFTTRRDIALARHSALVPTTESAVPEVITV